MDVSNREMTRFLVVGSEVDVKVQVIQPTRLVGPFCTASIGNDIFRTAEGTSDAE